MSYSWTINEARDPHPHGKPHLYIIDGKYIVDGKYIIDGKYIVDGKYIIDGKSIILLTIKCPKSILIHLMAMTNQLLQWLQDMQWIKKIS